MKAKVAGNVEPWTTGYQILQSQSWSSINYTMQGPFTVVGRDPSENLSQFENDMQAVYYQAIMWQMTGDSTYAAKATSIANAWATTHTSWSGATARLTANWSGTFFAQGCEILRYTYSGWTSTINDNVQNYLLNVFWPCIGGSGNDMPYLSDAVQGIPVTGLMIATFCNDSPRFNNVISQMNNHPCAGIMNMILDSGQTADFGRNMGYAQGVINSELTLSEIAWEQGFDQFAVRSNLFLTAAEYYCKYNLTNTVSFTPFGACYGYYTVPGSGQGLRTDVKALCNQILTAYVTRKGLSAPYTTQYRNLLSATDVTDFTLRKDWSNTDPYPSTTAQPWSALAAPTLVTSMTNADVGGVGFAGSGTYSGGTWTVQGGGYHIWGSWDDSFHFTYKQMIGDGTIIARVATHTGSDARANAGVMMRETLATDSKMIHVSYDPPALAQGVECFWRANPNGGIKGTDWGEQFHPNLNAPAWVKIVRRGSTFTAFDSPNGVTWTPVRYMYCSMASTIYVGLCVSSHTGASDTATFDNVAIGGTIPDGTYRLQNRASGKFLDNLGSVTDGALVAQWSGSSSLNQQWQISTTGSYRKLACVTGGKRLDSLGHTTNGSTVGQWSDSTSNNQQWTIQDLGTGFYKIINRANGRCLDTGGQTADGSTMQFRSSGTSNNQQWSLVPLF